jgi:hypothetical protein
MKKQKETPIKIGEIGITPDGQKVECRKFVPDKEGCIQCHFFADSLECLVKGKFACYSVNRPDFQSVYFKEL